jgi:NADH-quinone oxidoreductase subunit E
MAVLSEELRSKADEIVARYPQPRSALLPLLYLVQSEQGYVSQEGIGEVSDLLGLTTAEVDAVATYYTMFKKEPTGSWLVSVCTNLSCALAGGRGLYDRAVERLDQESPDGSEVAVEEVECLGACDAAPVVQVNYCNYDRVSGERLDEILDELFTGRVPEPSRGPEPVDHRETSRILGGVTEGG